MSDERARRAAENIVGGIIEALKQIGVDGIEGIDVFTAAVTEAIENEYPPSSALIGEVAEKIIGCVRLPKTIDVVTIIDVLTDFKRAIELGRAGPKVEDAAIAQLMEDALEYINSRLSGMCRELVIQLCAALEQQVEARREAEEQTRVWIAECERLNAAQLTKPTQSGEAVHDWPWALAMMKAGHPVRLPDHVEGGLVITKDGWIDFASADEDDHEPFLFAIEDFDSISWQLVPADAEEPGPCEQQ